MTYLTQYQSADAITDSDLFYVHKSGASDARKVSASVLASYIRSSIGDGKYTQRESPISTGFTVVVSGGLELSTEIWLKLTPLTTMAEGTIVLPPPASNTNNRIITVTSTQQITSLTINGNGAIAIYGAPAALSEYGCFSLRYDAAEMSWITMNKDS